MRRYAQELSENVVTVVQSRSEVRVVLGGLGLGWGVPGLHVRRLAVGLLGLRVYHHGQSLELFAVCHFEEHFEQVLRAVDDIFGELAHSFVLEEGVHPPPDYFAVDGELGRRHLFVRVVELVHCVSVIGRLQVDDII